MVSMLGLTTAFTPGPAAGTTGPALAGFSVPPITWSTVFTTVLLVRARGASHCTNCVNTVGVTLRSQPLAHTLWKVNGTQPPVFSAFVTDALRSARVQVLSTWSSAFR